MIIFYGDIAMASLAAKKIVLCSDGTGNSSAKSEKTNVWRLYQALDLSGPDQVAAYDDGVGTSRFKYWAIIEGAFGIGLKRNVLDLYKFESEWRRAESGRASAGHLWIRF
jgi:uncharacterized protein (DUF2235 family)